MITPLGTLDAGVLASVDDAGRVAPAGAASIDWWVVAEDRVHHPAGESSVRQRRIDGTPVVETLVRVPGGDVAATAYGVAGATPAVVIELENRSPAAVAVAFDRAVIADRTLHAPPPGAGLPDGSVLVPLGHRASVRVAVVASPSTVLAGVPSPAQVARGWLAQVAVGPRLVLPEPLDALVVPARCDALLAPERDGEASELLRAAAASERTNLPDDAVVDLAAAVERLGRRHRRAGELPWLDALALDAAAATFERAAERRAAGDVRELLARLAPAEPLPLAPPPTDHPLARVAWLRSQLVRPTGRGVELFAGVTSSWLGRPVEAHDVPTSHGTVGVAVRWHGERPALLWSCSRPVSLSAPALDPSWQSNDPSGETLLPVPPAALVAGAVVGDDA